jgi:hypothetical protein
MAQPDFKKMFDENYVVVPIDVMERPDKKGLENPGGQDTMKQFGGATAGLPFYVFLDAKGKKFADSNAMPPKGANIGYPGAPEEITAFMALIKKTAPRWSAADQEKLRSYLVANAPKAGPAH